MGRTTKGEAAERAIIRVADSLVMVLGGIERRFVLLGSQGKAALSEGISRVGRPGW